MEELRKELQEAQEAVSSFICLVIQAAVATSEQKLMETRKHIPIDDQKDSTRDDDTLSVQCTNILEDRTCCSFYYDNIMQKSTEKVALYLQKYHNDTEQSIYEQDYERKNKVRTFFHTTYRILTRKEKKALVCPMPKVKKDKPKRLWNCRIFCKKDKDEIIPSISDLQIGSTDDELDLNTSDIQEMPRPRLKPFFQQKQVTVENKTKHKGKGLSASLRGFLKHFTCCFG